MDRSKFWVTFNANITIPAGSHGGGGSSSGIGGASELPPIRFEYSWKSTPDVVLEASGRNYSGIPPPPPLVRNHSSSGYGSEQRCRSTCSITLQTGINRPEAEPEVVAEADVRDYPLRSVRRSSEGEAWDSHTRIHQLFRKSEEGETLSRKSMPDLPSVEVIFI